MFSVRYDRPANCIMVSVREFWKPDDVTALAAEIGAIAQQARRVRGDFNAIVESFDFPVQANDVADLLADIMRGAMAVTSGNAAVVVGSQLNKVQAERTLIHPRLQVFRTLEAAHAWLQQASLDRPTRIPPQQVA